MSGFWRKILDKKANAAYSPQAGDWEAMQSLIDKTPALGKASGGGAALFLSVSGILVILSALTAYMFLGTNDKSTAETEYYQARVVVDSPLWESDKPSIDEPQSENQSIRKQNSSTSLVSAVAAEAYTELPETIPGDVSGNAQHQSDIDDVPIQEAVVSRDTKVRNEHLSPVEDSYDMTKADEDDHVAELDKSLEDFDSEDAGTTEKGLPVAAGTLKDQPGENNVEVPAEDSETSESIVAETPAGSDNIKQDEDIVSGESEDVDQQQNTIESVPPVSEEEDSDVLVGLIKQMKFNSIAAKLEYCSLTSSGQYYAFGTGLELEWRLSQWRIQSGLGFQQWYEISGSDANRFTYIDTNYSAITENRSVSWVDSIWVITGVNSGEYVYDTSTAIVTDTIYVMNLDTMVINTEHPVPVTRMSSRFSVPVRISYRKRFGSFYGDLGAGLISNFTTYQPDYIGDSQRTSYSLDLALRPALGFQVGRRWSVEAAFNYALPLFQAPNDKLIFNRQHQWSVNLGLRYFLE